MKKLKLTDNALTVLTKRDYLKRDKDGRVVETPEKMFRRVAQAIAQVEKQYGANSRPVKDWEDKFYQAMANLEFLPNSPTLMHAGTKFNQLSACFVLPLADNLEGIFKSMEQTATIARTGGGVGIPLSNLRARGSRVRSTGGLTSGPISFLQLFNQMANVINEGSSRRVAMMAVMNVHHPDIMDFIFAKGVEEEVKNFNISVGVTDVFMKAVLANKDYDLIAPESGAVVKRMSARRVMDMITFQAWKTADPGMVFLDKMNAGSPVNHLGKIETTNPCGEQPLLPYESCNLGSINLAKVVISAKGRHEVDWEKLERLIRLGVRFLDNVIDACTYPLPEIDQMTKTTRKIGLGVMGWADLLVLLKVPYASSEALRLAERVAKFVQNIAREESQSLAKVRGSFPGFKGSLWDKQGYKEMRNSTVNTVAPTGTISIIANCSSGIEPLFALTYTRKNILDVDNTELVEVNQLFAATAKKGKFYNQALMKQISETGGIDGLAGVPKDIKEVFKVSHEIGWEWHVKMQAAWQKYIDAAVSKTINLSHEATPDDIRDAYLLAYETDCKGITVYRDGSKTKQVLNAGGGSAGQQPMIDTKRKWVGNGHRDEELCPECGGELTFKEGCATCLACGYSRCLIS
ncbi:ribonucleoside-diphosphate reductase, adenosylcobalamin-dependent [Candidatus Beckwithbacteria bacterium CG22_combo_CG10-13_8_21_14_all_01_47_9]|uniref:Vitamin B12-dependent ribonucleotide reductase n=5 Tax=Candidatus Beckwithiibacteriota TaxID=1752726 RepID=A0A2H0E1W4_9BACT|nr:MAG: ribonucleoside-diphosphate reductase, adenosylcobalamin-dependent [Candidatus Beckwithbacteria bacterium CG1_02_47_37]PIP52377.1 MAG: ribonucleoside-diphosphate reductase, adenosylcobalamin-dependent [Candidatus Beckwithbacteria bacterium CG23_combo_of_CG06-09_8_20_14_all_47_9]PIP88423.1 MAG: ribonucleoside-diphosphate reductase, adenosylcobalamin-dependent [Candidatus Beckwithbacteria bacterium CG22_combo_CG10-13_8_21_14_all_01_47_9]PJA21245.1 MAG: ribonucleoside-diphosphate reductase, 